MNEPRKPGRPTNAEREARAAKNLSDAIDEDVMDRVIGEVAVKRDRAQAYAMKVWSGQSESLGRGDRVRRVKAALEGQGMSMDGVKLPGDAADDDEDWTEEDAAPITWKKPQ